MAELKKTHQRKIFCGWIWGSKYAAPTEHINIFKHNYRLSEDFTVIFSALLYMPLSPPQLLLKEVSTPQHSV